MKKPLEITNKPLINSEELTDCAKRHPKKIASLTKAALEKKYELLCDCNESATLEDLLYGCECPECGEVYYYSFCWKEAVQDAETWHCNACNKCQDFAVWHCKSCNNCTYGLSLECEHCGKKSPYAPPK